MPAHFTHTQEKNMAHIPYYGEDVPADTDKGTKK